MPPSARLEKPESFASTEIAGAEVMGSAREGDAWHCLGQIAYRERQYEYSIECYDKAIAMGCFDPGMTHWNKSASLASIGRCAVEILYRFRLFWFRR
jgi:hypothetical protein